MESIGRSVRWKVRIWADDVMKFYEAGCEIDFILARARMTPGTRVIPTRSKPSRRLAAELVRTGVVGNTGSLGLLYSAETAETTRGRYI